MSHGFPAGVQIEASTRCHRCVYSVLLALCRVVLKVYNHKHVKKPSLLC